MVAAKWAQSLQDKAGLSDALVAWYDHDHRDLPWRHTTEPYHIWLSEIMLQQTQVNTVLPYYEKFLTLFPTLEDLANAPQQTVMKAWEGLGYYARCRNLQKAAQVIVERHGGRFPDTFEAVVDLPGIGRSTAGAILTFAFGKPHPLLDGNVKRVLSRLFDIDEDINQTKLQPELWMMSEALVLQAQNPGSFNQAFMELGATLCSPKSPSCLLCPLRGYCDAQKVGTQELRPVKVAKKPTPHHTIAVGVIHDGQGNVYLQRRPDEGLLGGLWEFPGGKQEPDEPLKDTVAREIKEEVGFSVVVGDKIAEVPHAYTHFKITLHAYHCQWLSGEPNPTAASEWAWVPWEKMSEYPFPKANKAVLEKLMAMDPPRSLDLVTP